VRNAAAAHRTYERAQRPLGSIVSKVLAANQHRLAAIFSMRSFLPLLDMFENEAQLDVGRSILDAFLRAARPVSASSSASASSSPTSSMIVNPMMLRALLVVGKNVHDSLTALSFDDDVRRIAQSLSLFVYQLDLFDDDLERALTFLMDARTAFGNIDRVRVALVAVACRLMDRLRREHRRRALERTNGADTEDIPPLGKSARSFARAALAFAVR